MVTISDSDWPTLVPGPIAQVLTFQVVRLSGRVNSTSAVPSAPVVTAAAQKAVSAKLVRMTGWTGGRSLSGAAVILNSASCKPTPAAPWGFAAPGIGAGAAIGAMAAFIILPPIPPISPRATRRVAALKIPIPARRRTRPNSPSRPRRASTGHETSGPGSTRSEVDATASTSRTIP